MLRFIVRLVAHVLVIRPLLYVWVGFNIKHRERLPRGGPAIIVSNHNSHFDTFAIESLLPLSFLRKLRPVAAADYFLKGRLLSWFTLRMMRIIPVRRGGTPNGEDPLAPCHEALDRGHILIVYAEGSRGEPEQMSEFKKGIAWLATKHPNVPVYPICFSGLGKVLPKGSFFPVPFFCDVAVGEPLYAKDSRDEFLKRLVSRMQELAQEVRLRPWT